MNAVVVERIECDERLLDSNDDPYTSELLAVFIDDERYSAEQKARDYITYVRGNSDTYIVEDEEYPVYQFRHCRCY